MPSDRFRQRSYRVPIRYIDDSEESENPVKRREQKSRRTADDRAPKRLPGRRREFDRIPGENEEAFEPVDPMPRESSRSERDSGTGSKLPVEGEAFKKDYDYEGSEPVSADVDSSPACLESGDVETLRGALQQSLAREKRWLADLENYRRRTERMFEEQAEMRKRALASDLLDIVDDFDRALEHSESAEAGLGQGVEAIRGKFLAVLARHGFKPFSPLHEPFDPTTQEAVSLVQHPDLDSNTVAEVLRPGWMAGDRLLRPAQVVVVKNP
jgi:molecular chaperone GrpE